MAEYAALLDDDMDDALIEAANKIEKEESSKSHPAFGNISNEINEQEKSHTNENSTFEINEENEITCISSDNDDADDSVIIIISPTQSSPNFYTPLSNHSFYDQEENDVENERQPNVIILR